MIKTKFITSVKVTSYGFVLFERQSRESMLIYPREHELSRASSLRLMRALDGWLLWRDYIPPATKFYWGHRK